MFCGVFPPMALKWQITMLRTPILPSSLHWTPLLGFIHLVPGVWDIVGIQGHFIGSALLKHSLMQRAGVSQIITQRRCWVWLRRSGKGSLRQWHLDRCHNDELQLSWGRDWERIPAWGNSLCKGSVAEGNMVSKRAEVQFGWSKREFGAR